jgi:hypothetical protein
MSLLRVQSGSAHHPLPHSEYRAASPLVGVSKACVAKKRANDGERNWCRLEIKMKVALFASLLVAVSQGAVAQTSECSRVPNASDRLACYDKATPPSAAKAMTSKNKAVAPDTPPDQETVVDALAVENAKLDAKLKRICRGC